MIRKKGSPPDDIQTDKVADTTDSNNISGVMGICAAYRAVALYIHEHGKLVIGHNRISCYSLFFEHFVRKARAYAARASTRAV